MNLSGMHRFTNPIGDMISKADTAACKTYQIR